MKIRLDSARFEPFAWQETLDFKPAALGFEEGVELTPVEVRGELSRLEPNFLLSARLAYRQSVPCDRCLRPVGGEVDSRLELLVVDHPRPAEGGERQLGEDELGVFELAGELLATEPLVAEQVQLNLPTHPLCREDCRGLCPRCGANLNDGPCGCAEPPGDPRWAALAGLRDKMPGRGTG